ncbi:zf-HC2 domain-containing protein [Brevibacillus humidisoli]|uniref:zf-HC2 domain-containing protein n=1 Tax=Brevibacillus humidisoli TaxID=2895522 RepID=UPI001E544A3A|nr:zf-HC2 domain-containing protein [Brevibacillus humidisoli]UFJ40705.1 zf-HC2 domain-containing protein [Brevibacillus humidisoli]
MECRESRLLIHEFLDGDIDELANNRLQEHLRACNDCRRHKHELQKAIAFVQSTSHVHAPADFTQRVLAQLPAPTKMNLMSVWLKQHPFIAAAAVFFFLMAGSLVASWFEPNQTLQVSSNDLDQLRVDRQRNVVVVPEGVTVTGDLIVRNGSVEVLGEVDGNVVAIDGKVFTASTAQIAGDVESIEAIFDWVWYQLKNVGNDLLPFAQ